MRPNVERAALARNILIFFAGIGVAGLLIGVLNEPFEAIAVASETVGQTQQAADGREYVLSYWDVLPFIIVVLSFFQLIGAAAAERRIGP